MRLRIFTEPQPAAGYATLRTVAQAAEQLGFGAFFRSDQGVMRGLRRSAMSAMVNRWFPVTL